MEKPCLFISYSTLDKKLAGTFKQRLSEAGFNVFLAHEDIKPTDEWLRKIERELKRCQVFIALLSEHFHKSEWADQEAGYALSRSRASRKKCLIVPILVSPLSHAPHGFLKDFQALKLYRLSIEQACDQLAEIIVDKLGLTDFKKDQVISKFALSGNFKTAKKHLGDLYELRPFSLDQSRRIAKATLSNNQIHWPQENHPRLRRLLADHFEELDSKTKEALRQLENW